MNKQWIRVVVIILFLVVMGAFNYWQYQQASSFGKDMMSGSSVESMKRWCTLWNVTLPNFDHLPVNAADAANWIVVEYKGKQVSPCEHITTNSRDLFHPSEIEKKTDFCWVKGSVKNPEIAVLVNESYCVFVEHTQQAKEALKRIENASSCSAQEDCANGSFCIELKCIEEEDIKYIG